MITCGFEANQISDAAAFEQRAGVEISDVSRGTTLCLDKGANGILLPTSSVSLSRSTQSCEISLLSSSVFPAPATSSSLVGTGVYINVPGGSMYHPFSAKMTLVDLSHIFCYKIYTYCCSALSLRNDPPVAQIDVYSSQHAQADPTFILAFNLLPRTTRR